jgi:DNA-binding NarL/FixJ family response regulator
MHANATVAATAVADSTPSLVISALAAGDNANTPACLGYRIIILKQQRFYAETLKRTVHSMFVSASVLVASCVAEAAMCLDDGPADLLIADVTFADGDLIDTLPEWTERTHRVRRVFVSTSRKEERIVDGLRHAGISGFFDESAEGPGEFEQALERVCAGGYYMSTTIAARMMASKPWSRTLLSPTEQLVLSVIGDGSDNQAAALQLGMAPSTVKSVREQLRQKLGVQHNGELIRNALQRGYTYIDSEGVSRPGIQSLRAAHKPRRVRGCGNTSDGPRATAA